MEVADPIIVQEFLQAIGIPVVEIEGQNGLVQLQFEKSGLFTIEPAPEKGGVYLSLSKTIDYFSAGRHGIKLLKFAQPDTSRSYVLKVGLMNGNFVVLCAFLEDDNFSTQMLFEILDTLRARMYELENV